jgi:hypothetical protein
MAPGTTTDTGAAAAAAATAAAAAAAALVVMAASATTVQPTTLPSPGTFSIGRPPSSDAAAPLPAAVTIVGAVDAAPTTGLGEGGAMVDLLSWQKEREHTLLTHTAALQAEIDALKAQLARSVAPQQPPHQGPVDAVRDEGSSAETTTATAPVVAGGHNQSHNHIHSPAVPPVSQPPTVDTHPAGLCPSVPVKTVPNTPDDRAAAAGAGEGLRSTLSASPSRTPAWVECASDEGVIYFYNHVTQASSWETPLDLYWALDGTLVEPRVGSASGASITDSVSNPTATLSATSPTNHIHIHIHVHDTGVQHQHGRCNSHCDRGCA